MIPGVESYQSIVLTTVSHAALLPPMMTHTAEGTVSQLPTYQMRHSEATS